MDLPTLDEVLGRMHILDHELFRGVMGIVEAWHGDQPTGYQLVASLLYTRLYQGFRMGGETLGDCATSVEIGAAVKGEAGSSADATPCVVTIGKPASEASNGSNGDTEIPFVAHSSKVIVSEATAIDLTGLASDIVSIQQLLPGAWYSGWAVTQVALACRDILSDDVVDEESARGSAASLLQAFASDEMDPSHPQWDNVVRVFRIYASAVLEWIAGNTVRSIESYHDFACLWDELLKNESFRECVVPRLGSAADFQPLPITPLNGDEIKSMQIYRAHEILWAISCKLSADEFGGNAASRRQRLIHTCLALTVIPSLLVDNEGERPPKKARPSTKTFLEKLVQRMGLGTQHHSGDTNLIDVVLEATGGLRSTRWSCWSSDGIDTVELGELEAAVPRIALLLKSPVEESSSDGADVMDRLKAYAAGILRDSTVLPRGTTNVSTIQFVEQSLLPSVGRLSTFCQRMKGGPVVEEDSAEALLCLDTLEPSESMTPDIKVKKDDEPVMLETVELTEWIVAILTTPEAIPRKAVTLLLQRIFGREWWMVLSSEFGKVVEVFCQMRKTMTIPNIMISDGRLVAESLVGARLQDQPILLSILVLFYHALESITMFPENDDLSELSRSRSTVFVRSLFACCYIAVVESSVLVRRFKPTISSQPETAVAITREMDCSPLSFIPVSTLFVKAMTTTPTALPVFPRLIARLFERNNRDILDAMLWDSRWKTMEYVAPLKENSQWPPPASIGKGTLSLDCRILACLVNRLVPMCINRISSVSRRMGVPEELSLTTTIVDAFLHLFYNKTEVLEDHHIDQWLVCTIYGILKIVNYSAATKFVTIIDAYEDVRRREIGEAEVKKVTRQVHLPDDTTGTVIDVYNKRYVPFMKDYLLSDENLKRKKKEVAASKEVKHEPRHA